MIQKNRFLSIFAGAFLLLMFLLSFSDLVSEIRWLAAGYLHFYTIVTLISYIADILLIILLFCNKKKLLLIPIGIEIFVNGYYLINFTSFGNVLYFIAYLLLFIFVIVSDSNKKNTLKYLWYLPAVLFLLILICNITVVNNISYIVLSIIEMVAVALIGYRLALDEDEDISNEEDKIVNGYIDMTKHVLLLIFTFGIWELVWVYRTTQFLNSISDEENRTPTNQLLLVMFVPFYFVYWYYQSAKRVDQLALTYGMISDTKIACLVLSLASCLFSRLISIVSPIILQIEVNKIENIKKRLA